MYVVVVERVDVDDKHIGCRARISKSVNTAGWAKIVLRQHLVELIELQRIFAFGNLKFARLNPSQKNAFLRADRAGASRDLREIGIDLERDCATMATTVINSHRTNPLSFP